MNRFLLIITLLFLSGFTSAQNYFGFVYEKDNQEHSIPYAKIYFVDLGTTIQSDHNGKWELAEAPAGINHVIVSATGYETSHQDITLDPETPTLLFLEPSHHELDKVIVSNNGLLHRESITNVESHLLTDLNKIPTTNLGEAIANIPGVYQTSKGTGISKPVIRGLSGSSVVTYVNSLRIENQQWGGDHGLPITSLGIGGVEVIKGPASLLYGADALGGVLYFVDEPYAERDQISGFVQSRFEHNSVGTSNQAGIRYSKHNIRFNAYAGYDNFADFGVPSGQQILNSRFYQYSGKFAFGYVKKKWVMNIRYNFYQGRIGLPGHTYDSIPDVSSFLTNNQSRNENVPAQVIQNNLVSVENKFFFKNQEIFLTLGNTNNNIKEHEEKFFFPDIMMNLNNSLYNIKWRARMKTNWEAIIGSQGMYQINQNGADAVEILIPNSTTLDAGLYGLLRYKSHHWHVMLGGRFDYRGINAEGFSRTYNGVNYSSGFAYMGDKSTVRFNVSSGFRAPTTSELLSDGVHHGSNRYEIGNDSLSTEKAIQFDGSYALHLDDLELIINPFYNHIRDYIYIEQADSIKDGYNVFIYKQASFAQLYGLDFGFHYHPHLSHWLHIECSFSNVFAEDDQKLPLPLIPQTRINTQLKFEFDMESKFQLTDIVLQNTYFFKQNRVSTYETETPAYNLLNLGVNMKIDWENPLFISCGVRNLLNTEYIDHLSRLKNLGLWGPGINAYLSLRYEFNKHIKHEH